MCTVCIKNGGMRARSPSPSNAHLGKNPASSKGDGAGHAFPQVWSPGSDIKLLD